ncbi:MAG: hypothetical protein JNK82_33735 [Myxococcaceae bacterium]|nr:hypothetical protein [Myxococcaceae bacterium]
MNRALFMLVTVAVACRGRGGESRWQTFTSREGGYTVELPDKPFTHVDATTHRKQDLLPDGTLRPGAPFVAEQTRAERGEDGVYTVRWYELPIDDDFTGRRFLERLIATKQLGPVFPRWIHLGPYQGIEYERIEPARGVLLRSRIFVVESRVFQLWADNWLAHDDEASARRFIDSFDLSVQPGLHVTYDGVVAKR